MKLAIRQEAVADIENIFAWIAADNPAAAISVVRRIREKIGALLTPGFAKMGRVGREEGTRELVVGSYIVVYEVRESDDEIIVLAVLHGARDRSGIKTPR
jgi:toxin ParE1/3/4